MQENFQKFTSNKFNNDLKYIRNYLSTIKLIPDTTYKKLEKRVKLRTKMHHKLAYDECITPADNKAQACQLAINQFQMKQF